MIRHLLGSTKLVEFFGLPRTGKTTVVKALNRHLLESGIKSEIVVERASVCPIQDKMDPLFNIWTTLALMKKYTEARDRGVQVLFADRGILDAKVWMQYKNRNGDFDSDERDLDLLSQAGFIRENMVVAYFFQAELDLVLDRDRKRRIGGGSGRVMNRTVLEGYVSEYRKVKPKLEQMTTIVEIDTSSLDIDELLSRVTLECRTLFLGQFDVTGERGRSA